MNLFVWPWHLLLEVVRLTKEQDRYLLAIDFAYANFPEKSKTEICWVYSDWFNVIFLYLSIDLYPDLYDNVMMVQNSKIISNDWIKQFGEIVFKHNLEIHFMRCVTAQALLFSIQTGAI